MSARPRTVEDGEILMAAGRAIARVGPAKLTLADVGAEVGLAPATLVQRFGSKRGLLLALARSAVEGVGSCFEAVRLAHGSPVEAVVAAAVEMARGTGTAEELANSLAFLQLDVSDPAFQAIAEAVFRETHAGYRALLDEAVAAGELAVCDTRGLARAVGAISGGSLISWAILREGTAESYVRADLESLLQPYRRRAGGSAGARRQVKVAAGKKRAARSSGKRTGK